MPAYYPVFLDVRGRRCVVLGGGVVGEEKSLRLLACGAAVVVIAPEVAPRVLDHAEAGRLSWIRRGYRRGDLEGAFIAIVADTSDPSVNAEVSKEAMSRNVPLNVVDVTELCTWIAPAIAERGEVSVAISTSGASPALARRMRLMLSQESPVASRHGAMEYAGLAPLLSEARAELGRRGIKLPPDHWQACLTDDLVDLVQEGRLDRASEMLMAGLLEGAGCGCQDGVCRKWVEMTTGATANEGRALSSAGR